MWATSFRSSSFADVRGVIAAWTSRSFVLGQTFVTGITSNRKVL